MAEGPAVTEVRSGHLGDADRARLEELASRVSQERRRLLYIGYGQAEEECERLASLLVSELGARELSGFSFRPIPRGGFIVLGMLAYLLDLPRERLSAPEVAGQPVVLVDDCALTGARFSAALRTTAAPRVVFAHLRSPRGLRAAVEAREPRVQCLAAHDLADDAESMPEAELQEWRELWRGRLGSDRYYLGRVEPVAFAWSEPDRLLWNAASGRLEEAWRLASPAECLRTRGRLGPAAAGPPEPRWRAASTVASADLGHEVWLCDTEGGRVISLEGTAAAMWRRLARHGDPALAAAELAEEFEVESTLLRRDLDELARRLCERGLLEPVEAGGVAEQCR